MYLTFDQSFINKSEAVLDASDSIDAVHDWHVDVEQDKGHRIHWSFTQIMALFGEITQKVVDILYNFFSIRKYDKLVLKFQLLEIHFDLRLCRILVVCKQD